MLSAQESELTELRSLRESIQEEITGLRAALDQEKAARKQVCGDSEGGGGGSFGRGLNSLTGKQEVTLFYSHFTILYTFQHYVWQMCHIPSHSFYF